MHLHYMHRNEYIQFHYLPLVFFFAVIYFYSVQCDFLSILYLFNWCACLLKSHNTKFDCVSLFYVSCGFFFFLSLSNREEDETMQNSLDLCYPSISDFIRNSMRFQCKVAFLFLFHWTRASVSVVVAVVCAHFQQNSMIEMIKMWHSERELLYLLIIMDNRQHHDGRCNK